MAKCIKCNKGTQKEHSIHLCEECYNKYLSYRTNLSITLLKIQKGEMLAEDMNIKPFFDDIHHKNITGTKRIPKKLDIYIYIYMRNKILHRGR